MDIINHNKFLLYRIRHFNDKSAFAKIYDLYKGKIYRYVYLKLSNPQDTEDITAEVFVRLWEYLRATEVDSINAVAYAIARNLVADHYRHKKTTAVIVEINEEIMDKMVGDSGKEARTLDIKIENDRLIGLIRGLKEEYRDALMMRFVDEMSVKEISEAINKSPNNTRVLIHRALNALKGMYDE